MNDYEKWDILHPSKETSSFQIDTLWCPRCLVTAEIIEASKLRGIYNTHESCLYFRDRLKSWRSYEIK